MKIRISLLIFYLFIISCERKEYFDIQGHRGYRGLYPENSIIGFKKSLELGIKTIELDVVISKDHEVLVSHEPWISSFICVNSKKEKIEDDINQFNIYELNYNEIKNFDCGIIGNDLFPFQKKISVYKPTLNEVFDSIEKFADDLSIFPYYNIEIKSNKKYDGIFHPEIDIFSELVINLIRDYSLSERVIIQSFDFRVLKYLKDNYPKTTLSLLVSDNYDIKKNIDDLGFLPDIYSPQFKFLSQEDVNFLKQKKIKIIPWTVNSNSDIADVLNLEVDGIISDYPERVIELKKNDKKNL